MENLKEHLFLGGRDYKIFVLLPAIQKLLGVRLPKLRKTAALISERSEQNFLDFIYNMNTIL